ncbi:MAG: pilus assembly protein N-terminal domain-containing protein [Polyangiales bacterium]
MRRLALFSAFLLLSTSVPNLALAQKKGKPPAEQPPSTATEELNLAVGENKTIPATDVKNYSEGTPGIVDVKLTSDASAFVIVGLKSGSTSLLLIKKNGQEVTWTINVFSRSPQIVENELKQLLEGYTGVKVRRVGSRLFIEGSVASENDVKRIQQIATLYGGQVESLVGIGATKDRTNIRIDFFFVQYHRESGYQIGISYPPRIGGEFIQSTVTYDFFADVGHRTSAVASVVNQPLPGLDIASHYGWAKVLKQASVITTNGTDANLETGGEQNFQVATGLTGTIQKIAFGTNVTVQPFFDPGTRELEVKVLADVSDLTPPVTTATNLPGRQVTKVSTIVHMKLGQSLVLSGFHTESESRTAAGLPLLKDIPIIGVLFGSHGHSTDEVEGAVFIIPSVVEPAAKPAMDIVNETMKQYEQWSGTPVLGGKVPNVYDKSPNHFEPPPVAPPAPPKK